jgi:hypothetical protein
MIKCLKKNDASLTMVEIGGDKKLDFVALPDTPAENLRTLLRSKCGAHDSYGLLHARQQLVLS